MKIAIDVMGTDHGPEPIIAGALAGAKKYPCEVILVGNEEVIQAILDKKGVTAPNVTVQHASQVIEMSESQSDGLRKKKD